MALPAERKDALAKRGEALRKAYAEKPRAQLDGRDLWLGRKPDLDRAAFAPNYGRKIRKRGLVARLGANTFQSSWPHRLWAMEKHYHYIGGSGGYGEGYNAPAAVGAALANRALGRFSVNIQADGDLMYAPGALWTAVASQGAAAQRDA